MTNPSRPGALSRFTVLDASRVRAGPTAVRLFADMGARVIKLEIPAGAPGGDDMIGGRDHNRADYENLHRNKESLTLNMKTPEGVAILHELVKKADVFIENYRPDVKHRLGIGPDELRAINPRLVYASISGFGQDGPYADWPGFDSIAQGMGGLMSVTGKPGRRPDARRHSARRPVRRPLLRDGHPDRAARARGVRRGPVGADLAARVADRDARLPGRAVADRRPGAGPARQRASADRADRRVPDAATATSTSRPSARRCGCGCARRWACRHLVDEPGLGSDPERVANRDRVNAAVGRCLTDAHDRRMDRAAAEGRRALRPDPHASTTSSPTRRCSTWASAGR